MQLSRQKSLLLVLLSTFACHDTTAPETVSAYFVLQTINGRALPTFLSATPGPTTTIISSSLMLDKTGKAVTIEHREDTFQGEGTYTTTYHYTIHDNQIEIGPFSPCLDTTMCPGNLIGTISPSGLTLIINPISPDFQIVYQYRSLGLD